MVFFSSMPIICRLGLNLKARPSWCPKALPSSLYILKKKFSLSSIEWSTSSTMSSSPDSVFQMVHTLVRFPQGSYLAYWVVIFQHCFSLAFLQQLYLLPEFNFYVLDRCPYLIQRFAFFFFGLFERSYRCSFEFSVWEMVQIILFEVHYWLGLVNIFVGNIPSCFLFCII